MRTFLTSVATFFLLTTTAFAAIDTSHIGFVRSAIWFDHEPFFSGETVRVYTTLANSTAADFKGTVEFYDDEVQIGRATLSLERNGGFQTVWTDWVPAEGDHAVSVKISSGVLTDASGEAQEVRSEGGNTQKLTRFVDTDTDGDRIGNREDNDDDGDGIPDENDAEPLVAYSEPSGEDEALASTTISRVEEFAGEAVKQVAAFASSTSPKIKSGVVAVANAVEEFRTTQKKNIDTQIKGVKIRLAERDIQSDTPEGEEKQKHSPFDQVELLALTLAGFTFSNTFVFYLAGVLFTFFILVKFLPWIYHKVRGREEW